MNRFNWTRVCARGALVAAALTGYAHAQQARPQKPNIVFILVDNVGWGDFSVYGGSTPTPRIDKLANDGIRFTNYTVESQCTPSRSAIMTGRQSVRSGTFTVPIPGAGKSGLTPWEYTIAELLSDSGYATSLWGKWHLGEDEGRLPTDQGFDEWWGSWPGKVPAGIVTDEMLSAHLRRRVDFGHSETGSTEVVARQR
jgi:arylsulfatase